MLLRTFFLSSVGFRAHSRQPSRSSCAPSVLVFDLCAGRAIIVAGIDDQKVDSFALRLHEERSAHRTRSYNSSRVCSSLLSNQKADTQRSTMMKKANMIILVATICTHGLLNRFPSGRVSGWPGLAAAARRTGLDASAARIIRATPA